MKQLPARSTLSDANRKRDNKVFAVLYSKLFLYYKTSLQGNGLDIGGDAVARRGEFFESTTGTLFKEMLKVAGWDPLKGKKKGGAKVFAKMNLAEGVPNYICIRSAATNENMFLKVMELPEHGIAVFDKGYNRYSSFEKWDSSNRYFVTRKKDNARYE